MRINNGRPVREKPFKIDENFSETRSWNDALKLQCHSSSLDNVFNKKVLIEDEDKKKLFTPKILSLFVQRILSGFSNGHVFEIKFCFDFPSSLRMAFDLKFQLQIPIRSVTKISNVFWFKISASNSHSFGDENLKGENRENHSECGRAQHRRRQAHLCIVALQGHNIQVDEQVNK